MKNYYGNHIADTNRTPYDDEPENVCFYCGEKIFAFETREFDNVDTCEDCYNEKMKELGY